MGHESSYFLGISKENFSNSPVMASGGDMFYG